MKFRTGYINVTQCRHSTGPSLPMWLWKRTMRCIIHCMFAMAIGDCLATLFIRLFVQYPHVGCTSPPIGVIIATACPCRIRVACLEIVIGYSLHNMCACVDNSQYTVVDHCFIVINYIFVSTAVKSTPCFISPGTLLFTNITLSFLYRF